MVCAKDASKKMGEFTLIDRFLKKHFGNKNQKREAIEDEIEEHKTYVEYYQKEITFHESQMHELQKKLRELQ